MRINDTYGRFNNPAVTTVRQGPGAANTPKSDGEETAGTSTGAAEKVTVSPQAQEAAAQAEVNRVNQLRAAIENGTFQIDHQAIARRIVDGG